MARMSKGDRAQRRFERRQDALAGPITWKTCAAVGSVFEVGGAAVGAVVGGLVSGMKGAGMGAAVGIVAGAVGGAMLPR